VKSVVDLVRVLRAPFDVPSSERSTDETPPSRTIPLRRRSAGRAPHAADYPARPRLLIFRGEVAVIFDIDFVFDFTDAAVGRVTVD
jgi:hypothetical protein